MKLVAVLLVPSVAFANVYDAALPAPERDHVVFVGVTAGAMDALHLGLSIDGSKRLGGSLFAHAQVEGGVSSRLGAGENGGYAGVRGGVESRHCVGDPDILCGVVGLDLGYMHDSNPAMNDLVQRHTILVVPRAAIEFGPRGRVRVGLDGALARDGMSRQIALDGLMLSIGAGATF